MGALATTLFGMLTGYLIRAKEKTPIEKVALMFVGFRLHDHRLVLESVVSH